MYKNSGVFLSLLYFFSVLGEDGQQVRIVCVPDFCVSKTVAVVNLSNLECYSMSFA